MSYYFSSVELILIISDANEKQKKLAVIALGGNALLRGTQIGTIEEQEQNTLETKGGIKFY